MASAAIDRTVLPVEDVLHSSDIAHVGAFHCMPEDPLFHDSGPTRNHIFVFPRTTVAIEHDDRPEFVATPQGITFYNRGQHYRRRAVSPDRGDVCDFFAVAPDVLLDAMRAHDATVDDRTDRPFQFPYIEIPPSIFQRERAAVDLMRSGADALDVEEALVWLVDSVMASASSARGTTTLPRSAAERVEHAKALLASELERPLSIRTIADATGTSVYYLCKIFRRQTGLTMSTYRLQLRLRHAYDEVAASTDLLDTALRLGFSSHSYFTYAFRSYFGITPSQARDRARG